MVMWSGFYVAGGDQLTRRGFCWRWRWHCQVGVCWKKNRSCCRCSYTTLRLAAACRRACLLALGGVQLAAFYLRGRAAVAVVGGGTVIRWWRCFPSSLLLVGRVVTGCVLFFGYLVKMACD
jgi:hypothetical protein